MGEGKHETNVDRDGFVKGGYDHASTKDVSESTSGQHSKDDKGDNDDPDDE